jgi:hypothetical protein
MDGSFRREYYYRLPTNVGSRLESPGDGLSGYNGLEVQFDVNLPEDSRTVFQRSYLEIQGQVVSYTGTSATPFDVPATTSIPWNPIAAFIRTADLQFNGQQSVERQTNFIGHATNVSYLTRYGRQTLESMDDSLFTPCIEDVRDTFGAGVDGLHRGLSKQSADRAANWLYATSYVLTDPPTPPTNVPKHVRKNIYLCDLFDSLRVPAATRARRLLLRTRFNDGNQILFHGAALGAHTVKFIISGVVLHMCYANLEHEAFEEDKATSASSVLNNIGFYSYECSSLAFNTGSNDLIIPTAVNLQGVVALIPSTEAMDGANRNDPATSGVGINPYQYCYACAAPSAGVFSGLGGVTSFYTTYNQLTSPQEPIMFTSRGLQTTAVGATNVLSNVGAWDNSELFAQYRVLAKKPNNRDLTTAITMSHMGSPKQGTLDEDGRPRGDCTPYALFCGYFYPLLDTYPHPTFTPSALSCRFTGGTGPIQVVLCRIKYAYYDIGGDQTISAYNSMS